MKIVRHRKLFIALCILLAFLVLLESAFCVLLVFSVTVDNSARTTPSYAREDISALAVKPQWTEEDYETLFRQTGLGKTALDDLRKAGRLDELSVYQSNFFFEGKIVHEFTPGVYTTLHDLLYEIQLDENGDPAKDKNGNEIQTQRLARFAPLEDGDVLVTSTCHTFGWRNGHAALLTDARSLTVLESVALGMDSRLTSGGARWFAEAANFIVLRLKGASKEERAEIAAEARQNLCGVPYSLTVGVLSAKDQCEGGEKAGATHCAHLVWQAYKNFGFDIDANGGSVVTVKNIAQCDLFEVVQVYGFDPYLLWE